MLYGLTHKQQELLQFIQARLAVSLVPPSYAEMMRHLGLKSKSGVARLVDGLVERGHLNRIPNGTRVISLRLPGEPPAPEPLEASAKLMAEGIRLRLGPKISARLLAHCRQHGIAPEQAILVAINASIGGRQ